MTNAREFDPAMEVLCSIPMAPGSVLLKDLVKSLGLESQKSLRQLLAELSRTFPGVRVANDENGGGRAVSISITYWNETYEAGEAYWRKVHGDGHRSITKP